MSESLTHAGEIWLWTSAEGKGSWHFLTLDGAAGEAIAAHEAMRRLELGRGRGFGSVRVEARIGASRWTTSVFPSASAGGYILPIKAAIRRAEGLAAGDRAEVVLTLS